MSFKTEQETFWAGHFGDQYSDRNVGADAIAANVALFSKILSATRKVNSVFELGCNIGLNLQALRSVLPAAEIEAVEINAKAVGTALESGAANRVLQGSLLDVQPEKTYDLVFTKGVLIHISPDMLDVAYQQLYSLSNRYVMVCEYYNPSPVEIEYRGHQGKLFKRDFASDLLDRYPDLALVDYGFVWRRDPNFPQDDATWFLLEKK